jgi:hypothetical protein
MTDLDRMIEELREWEDKAENMKYDGWYQNSYREKLIEVKKFCDKLNEKTLILHGSN